MTAVYVEQAKVDEARLLLERIALDFAPAVFTTSFGAEDMVVLDLLGRDLRTISVATLDTGRLPQETYDVWQRAEERYARKIVPVLPRHEAVEHYIRINGVNGFYDSVAQRKECCQIRKVEPLARVLAGQRAWITGLRRTQAASRAELAVSEWDASHSIQKFNPLADWSEAEVWAYLQSRSVPYNALHDAGYPSIGCAPCTRAIKAGEDIRAGRWWWEDPAGKECGLHVQEAASV
jgi:phosphoadenosine phosphosulfate reductase